MKYEMESNPFIKNRKKDDVSKTEEMVELDQLGSFMEIGETSKKTETEEKEEQDLHSEVLSDAPVVESSDNLVEQIQNLELQIKTVADREDKPADSKEPSVENVAAQLLEDDIEEEESEEGSFLERRRKKREKKLFERQRKLYIFSRMKTNWLSFAPFVFFIVCFPWISYVKSPDSILKGFAEWDGTTPVDYILYQKSVWFLIMVQFCVLFGLFYQRKLERKKDMILRLIFLFLTVYSILIVVSAMLSQYVGISLWGAEEQREGIFVLLSYVVLSVTAVSLYRKENDYKVIFWSLSVLVGVLMLFLVANTMEYHFYDSIFLQSWKQLSPFDSVSPELLQSVQLYALTLSDTELGTLCALLMPFFTVMAIFSKEKKMYGVSIGMAICCCILLFFSTSRAGLFGVAVAFFVLLVTSVRKWVRHYKQTLGVIAVLAVFCAGISIATNGEVFVKANEWKQNFCEVFQNQENFDYRKDLPIKDVSVDGKRLFFTMSEEVLEMDYTTGAINCFDHSGQFVEFKKEDGVRYTTEDSRFVDISFETEMIQTTVKEKEEKRKILRLYHKNQPVFIINLAGLPEKAFLDTQYKNLKMVEAPYFGFEGKEKYANNRGYVWSRTIPLFKQTVWRGFGAGAFSKVFPQGDVLAKWYVYGTPNVAISQVNNGYLQMGVEQGLLALLIWIVILCFYCVDSFVLYFFRKEYNVTEIFGFAIFIALVGYSADIFFVSTSVSVAPLFWCLFGFGMGANHWVRRMREQEEAKMSGI